MMLAWQSTQALSPTYVAPSIVGGAIVVPPTVEQELTSSASPPRPAQSVTAAARRKEIDFGLVIVCAVEVPGMIRPARIATWILISASGPGQPANPIKERGADRHWIREQHRAARRDIGHQRHPGVEIGMEVSDINIKPPPFTNEQIKSFLL